MVKHLLGGLLALLPLVAAQAQTATGRVVAQATGAPLPGTTVRLDGQPAGTLTEADGRFRLPVAGAAPAARLVFSHLGYQSRTLPLGELGPSVALEELSYQIGEVLVTYESLRKLLLKKWKIDESALPAVTDNFLADLQQTDSVKAKKLQRNPGSVRAMLKLARLVFLPDGTVKTKFLLFSASGKWELDEAQRTLRVVGSKGEADTMTVVELTPTRLVVRDTKANRQDEVYIPVE